MDTTKEKTIGGTDANGFAINTPISTTQLQPAQPLNIPTQTPDFSPFISAINNAGSYTNTALLNTEAELAAQAQMDAQNKGSALSNLMAQTQAQIGNRGADTAQAYQTGGVNDLAKQLRTLNAQAQGLNLEAQAIPIQIQQQAQGQGVTDRGVAPIQAGRLRENALKALSIAQQSAVAQADYATAKDLADQQIALKYDALENDLKVKQLQLNALDKYVLTPAQEKAKESRALALKREEQDLADKKEQEKAINKLIIDASPVAPTDVLQRAKDVQAKGGNATEVALALGVYGGDYLKNELLREQIKQERAKTSTIGVDGRGVVTQNGVQLIKVTPKEIQDLNDTQIAKNSLVSLVDNMINSIDKYGTQVLFGKEAGTRGGAKTNLLLAMKNLEKTGALDKGTIDVLAGTIPDSEFFATEAAQKAALQQLRDTVVNKTDEYINSYRGTTAEVDPRTKRIYEKTGATSIVIPQGVSSAGAAYAQSTMNLVNDVNNQVNTQQSYQGYDTGIK